MSGDLEKRSGSTGNGAGKVEIPRLPWEKRTTESVRAFSYFAHYRDMLAERSKTQCARDVNLSLARISELAAKHDWDERAEAYDLDLDRRLRAQRETDIDAMNRRQGQLGQAAQSLAGRRMQTLEPQELDAGELARLLEVGVKIERLSKGLPTEVMRGAVSISSAEFQRYVSDIVGAMLAFVPEDYRVAALAAAEAVFERRGRQ